MRAISWRVFLFVVFVAVSSTFGFDTGYHSDVTRSVLREQGFGETAVRIVQVENWLVDYYSNSPTSPEPVKAELVKLHFDNLFSTKEVTWYWGWLSENTMNTARKAAQDNDPHLLLTTIAISLHAVQDFYAHSNWTEAHARNNQQYKVATFLSAGAPANFELFTGIYDSFPSTPPPGHPQHGGYGDGLNKDSQVRPKWDEAYVFSYCAGWEWVARIKEEVDAVNPAFWNQTRQFSVSEEDQSKLRRDEEAAFKISMWISAAGQDGHWKGNRSGFTASFLAIAGAWAAESDSIFVRQIKEKLIQNMLTPKLYQGGEPPALPAFPSFNLSRRAIAIRFTNVKEGETSLFEADIDTGNDADFYAEVKVGDSLYVERVIQNDDNFNAPWFVLAFVDSAILSTNIRIDLFDEDGGVAGAPDHCDIHPSSGRRYVAITVRVADGHLSGDADGIHDSAVSALTFKGEPPNDDRARV